MAAQRSTIAVSIHRTLALWPRNASAFPGRGGRFLPSLDSIGVLERQSAAGFLSAVGERGPLRGGARRWRRRRGGEWRAWRTSSAVREDAARRGRGCGRRGPRRTWRGRGGGRVRRG